MGTCQGRHCFGGSPLHTGVLRTYIWLGTTVGGLAVYHQAAGRGEG